MPGKNLGHLGLFLLIAAMAAEEMNDPALLHVSVNTENEVARVNTGFLSFTTETGRFMRRQIPYHNRHHKKQQRFLALCQGLSLQNRFPSAYWRIGGRKSSELVFRKHGDQNFNPEKNSFNAHDWDELHTFARKLNWTVNFAINGLLRNKDGSWNSSNAEELLRYTSTKGYNVNYDLGKGKLTIESNQLETFHTETKSVEKQYIKEISLKGRKSTIPLFCWGDETALSEETDMSPRGLMQWVKAHAPVRASTLKRYCA